VGGWLAGLPLTSGPVSLFLGLQYGNEFAAKAAVGTLCGLTAVGAFCGAYGLASRHAPWPVCLATGTAAFSVAIASLRIGATPSPFFAFVLVISWLILLLLLSSRLVSGNRKPEPMVDASLTAPRWDLLLRMIIATSLVLLLTQTAKVLGPELAGLLAPFPIFTATLVVFAHKRQGFQAARSLLRGVLLGSFAFATFFYVVGTLLERTSLGVSFLFAGIAAICVNLIVLLQRGHASKAESFEAVRDRSSASTIKPAARQRCGK
jgi:hypothetical protein